MQEDEEVLPRNGVLLGVLAGVGGAIVWMLFALVTRWRLRLLAVAIGLLIGFAIRRDVRGAQDVRVPVISALLAAGALFLGEYLLMMVLAPELSVAVGRTVTPPYGPGEFFFLLFQTVDTGALVAWAGGAAAAFGVPAGALRRIEHIENAAAVRDEQSRMHEKSRRQDSPPPRRATGSARVRCASCDEMVDSNTTTQTDAGIVCEDCLVKSEGSANASASYRD